MGKKGQSVRKKNRQNLQQDPAQAQNMASGDRGRETLTTAVGGMLAAFLSARSISYLMNLRGGVPFSSSVFTLLLWGALSWVFVCTLRRGLQDKRRLLFTSALSLFFGVLLTAGYQLQWQGYTEPGFVGKAKLILHGLFVGMAVLPFADGGFALAEKNLSSERVTRSAGTTAEAQSSDRAAAGARTAGGKTGRGKWIFPAAFLGIWLCWIPVWLAYYPVIMSYDFHKQSLEALLGPKYFNNHHPLAHTWLIYLFRNLGERLDSYETGFALFSLLQQMFTAAVLGYACLMVWRLVRKKWAVLAAALFFACFPLISVFVMCTTKDVLFGAFFVLFLLLMLESNMGGNRTLSCVCLVAAGVLMILFRNNAFHAMVLFGILYLLMCGRERRLRGCVLIALVLVLGKGALAGLQYGFQAHKGSEIEKYSVIYQSMARVGNRQSDNLTEADFLLLDTYVTRECWADYNPPLADTIKASVQKVNFNEKKSWNDMGAVFAAWLRIGLHYPNEYIDAFLDLTRGYWFLDDTSHAEMLGVGQEERMGLLYTYNSAAQESLPGMQHISKFPWLEEKLERLLSNNEYTSYPVVANLFKPALWCWLPVIGVVWLVYRRERAKIPVLLYPLCYLATMLLGPTAIVRYVYPFILFAPVMIAVLFARKDVVEKHQ